MQTLKNLGPSVAVSKIDLLFLSRIEKRWKNGKKWIFHWAICKDCLVHGNRAIVCITIYSDGKTNFPLTVTIIRRLSLYSAWLRLQEGEEGGRQGGGQIGWIWGSMGCAGFGTGVLALANRSLQLEALFRTLLHPLWQIGKCPQQMYFPNSLTSAPAHPPHLQGFVEFQMQSLVLVIFVLWSEVIVARWRQKCKKQPTFPSVNGCCCCCCFPLVNGPWW